MLLVVFSLYCFCSKLNAQRLRPAIVIDTSNFSLSIDSSTLTLHKDISDRMFWLDILSRDTILISDLKRHYKDDNSTITILKISPALHPDVGYEFKLFCTRKMEPVKLVGDSLPIPMIKRRPIYYNVKIISTTGTLAKRITKVEYLWSEL